MVQSVADARAAAAGGADRLEVVRDIERGGLTPPIDLVRAIADATSLPLRVMVRENDGFAIARPQELAVLQRAVGDLAALPVEGVVLGFLRGGALDLETTHAVLSAAPEIRATFHRALDEVRDTAAAIDALRELPQIDRILTDGGGGPWPERCERWRQYAAYAGDRVTILAGGGIDEDALRTLAAAGCVREVHVGGAARDPQHPAAPVCAERVHRLKRLTLPGATGDRR